MCSHPVAFFFLLLSAVLLFISLALRLLMSPIWTRHFISGGSNGKESAYSWETWVQSPGRKDLLKKGMAAHSSVLAWKFPWTEEPGGLQSIGVAKSQTRLNNLTRTQTHTHVQDARCEATGE